MALPDNVRIFTGVTPNEFDPDIMIEAAKGQGLTKVIIIGWDKDGDLFFSANDGDGPECLWLLEIAKTQLIKNSMED